MMRKGHGIIEFILMMFLLLLFVISVFYLVAAGSAAHEKVEVVGDDISNLRIGISYIDNKIKQAQNGNVSLRYLKEIDSEVIAIRENGEEADMETIIYCRAGELMEAYHKVSEALNFELSTPIVKVGSMKLESMDSKLISVVLLGQEGRKSNLLIDLDVRRRIDE